MGATTSDILTLRKTETIVSYGMLGSATIYNGAFVMRTAAGYATDATDAASSVFLGVAMEGKTASSTSGATQILVETSGRHLCVIAAATIADIGKRVYLTDNQTVQLAASTYCMLVGRIVAYEDTTHVWVEIEGADSRHSLAYGNGLEGIRVVVGQAAFTTTATTCHFAVTPITTVVAAALAYNDTAAVVTGNRPLMYGKTLTTSSGVYYMTVTRCGTATSGQGFGYIVYGT
jgi:hypothetical protein